MLKEQEVREIYLRHKDALYRLCYCYTGNIQDASDALQNTVVKLLERSEGFESAAHERGWIMKVAVNECRQILRHWWRKTTGLEACMEYPAQQEQYEENGLLTLVMGLPRKYRTVIYMYYYEGYSAREISELLGAKESTVLSWLRRGRQGLKVKMEESEIPAKEGGNQA